MDHTLEFEKPVQDLENQIKDLQKSSTGKSLDLTQEIKVLQKKVEELTIDIYQNLTPWQRVQLSRHPKRPHTSDYIKNMISDFHEIHGDRKFSDDPSMICGLGYLGDLKIAVIGIEKGRKTQDKIKRNFGMAHPEGYRKALRVMQLASRFNIPILTFIDTPGAYPGIGAEERGQAMAIAENLEEMFGINVPIVSVVIGEGGSGGALGVAVANKVFMLEHSIYSVISPESCASILWSNPKMAESAANALKLGPDQALKMKVIDDIIKEPIGGAHKNYEKASELIREKVLKALKNLAKMSPEKIKEDRFNKFRQMGNQTLENLEALK